MINFSKIMKKAFTLSEVLLVVGIIGLVSALTIPNVNRGVNEEKFAVLFRSTIEQLNAAQGKLLSEYGSIENATSDCDRDKQICYGNKLVNYLDVALNCTNTGSTRCFLDSNMFEFDGSSSIRDSGGYSFVLQNGASVYIRSMNLASTTSGVDVDLDGPNKGPNRKGYDIFVLQTNLDLYFEPREMRNEVMNNDGSLKIINEYDFYSEWLYNYGNMDYLKCPNDLNWVNKHSCS